MNYQAIITDIKDIISSGQKIIKDPLFKEKSYFFGQNRSYK